MFGALLAAVTVSLAAAPERALSFEPTLGLRLVSGSEWDTNARRAVDTDVVLLQNASPSSVVVGDGLLRMVVDATLDLAITPADQLTVSYLLGAKRFFRERTEDLLAHDLNLETSHLIGDLLELDTQGHLRASRVRNGLRDYTISSGGGGAVLHFLEALSLSARARYEGFGFGVEPALSWQGPAVSTELAMRPTRRLWLSAFVEHAWRHYRGVALIEVPSGFGQSSFATDTCRGAAAPPCVPELRADRELSLGGRALYRAGFMVSLELSARLQRSNSDFERVDRYRASGLVTVPLPLELFLSVMGSLQYNRGLSVTDAKNLVEDDENQNSVEVQLSRKLTSELGVDLRYSAYANGFATAQTRFLRQTIYLGLSYELGESS